MTQTDAAPAATRRRPPLVTQPSPMPTNKVMAGGLAGAVVSAGIFVAQQVNPEFVMGDSATAAFTTLVSFALSWLIRDRAPAA